MTSKEKITYIKEQFDRFLKDNHAYDAWYERYRLDNLIYEEEVAIEHFIANMLKKAENGDDAALGRIFYHGIAGTAMCTNEGDKFIAENKKCDILSNNAMSDLDLKWVETWQEYINVEKLK